MKKNITKLSLIILVIVFLAITITKLNTSDNSKEIKIGVIASLTGPGAYFGEQFINGLNIAIEEINDNGGIKNKKIKLIIEDSKTDNTTALTVAKKLVEIDNVSIILGDSWNSTTLTIMPYINQKKIVMISPNASLDVFTKDDYFFRLVPKTSDFMKVLAEYANKNDIKTVAFARASGVFGEEHYTDFKSEFEKLGGKIVADETFDVKSTDVRSELMKIKDKTPDAVFDLHASGPSVGLLISQAEQLGIKTKYIGTWSVENSALLKQYGKEIESIIYPFMFDGENSKTTKLFSEKIILDNKTMDFFIASGYDIANIITDTIKNTGSTDSDKIKDELLRIKEYDGVSGKFSFDKNGDAIRNIFIKTVKNGSFIKL
jgi:branched-chain amino acid transport system substrate-binding protein